MEMIESGNNTCLLAGSLGSGNVPEIDLGDAVGGSGMNADASEWDLSSEF